MQLEQVSNGPMGVGAIIYRHNSRSGTVVEGTMEVIELQPNRAVGMVIHDGPVKMIGRASYEAEGDAQTTLTIEVDIPALDESTDPGVLTGAMQPSLRNIMHLIESEVYE